MAPEKIRPSGGPGPIVLTVPLPGYRIDAKPDYSLGERVDRVVKKHFDVNRILIRALSSTDHPRYSLDRLADVILHAGTDRYDPDREGVSRLEFEPYAPDLQAAPFQIDEGDASVFGGIMRNFYENAPLDRGYPLRIDLLLIYDREQLLPAERSDPDRPGVHPRLERFLFRFRNPDRKKDALLGLVKIL